MDHVSFLRYSCDGIAERYGGVCFVWHRNAYRHLPTRDLDALRTLRCDSALLLLAEGDSRRDRGAGRFRYDYAWTLRVRI